MSPNQYTCNCPSGYSRLGSSTPLARGLRGLLALAAASMISFSAEAASYYWDPNGATPDASTSATGAWNGTNAFWNTDSTGEGGGTLSAGTTTADDLFFSTAGYTAGGTVTLSAASQGAKSITFGLGSITLTGGNITLGTGAITAEAGSGPNTITSTLLFNNNTITNNSGSLLTINAGNTNAGTLTIAGSGTVSALNGNSFGSGAVFINPESTVVAGAGLNSRFTGSGTFSTSSNSIFGNTAFLNGFTGTFNVSTTGGGKAEIGGAGATIGSGATVNIANGATLYTKNVTGAVNGVTYNVAGLGNTEYSGALRTDSIIGATSTINLLADASIGGSGTIQAPITGGYSLYKLNSGQLTVTGTSTYTGDTNVRYGTLLLAGAGQLPNTSLVSVSGGTLISGSTTDAVTVNRINSAAGLSLGGDNGGGTFTLTKPTAGTSTQAFTGLTLGRGWSAITNAAGASALSFTADGGSVYTRNQGGFINFATNTVSFANAPTDSTGVSVTNSGTPANDILIGAVLNNVDFVSASAGALVAPTYTANTFGVGINTNITANGTFSGDTQSIRFAGGNTTATISGTTLISSGGILSGSTGTQNIAGGAIMARSGQNLVIYGGGGNNLNITSTIVDNNGSGLERLGGNTVQIGGDNTFTGPVYLSQGTIQLNHVNALGTGTTPIYIVGGVTMRSSVNNVVYNRPFVFSPGQGLTIEANAPSTTIASSLSLSGSGNGYSLNKTGTGALYFTGYAVGTPNIGLSINGGTLDVTGTINSTNGGWNLAGSGAGSTINVRENGILGLTGDFNFAQSNGTVATPNRLTMNIADNAFATTARAFIGKANNVVATINQTGGIFSPNQLYMGASSTGSNTTAIYNLNGGVLKLNSNTMSIDTNSVVNLNGGTIQYTGNNGLTNSTNNQTATVGGVAGRLVAKAGGGTLDTLSGVTYTISAPIIHDAGLGATVDGGLTKIGTGKMILSGANTYTGATTINNGTLVASAADVAGISGALGNGGAITFGGGILQYVAASAGSDYSSRMLNSTGAISIDTNGQHLVYANPIDGTNTGGLTLNDTAGTKGSLTLSAANTFSGNTTVTAGTLKLLNSLALQNSILTTGGNNLVLDSSVASRAFTLGGLSGINALALKDNANNAIALTIGNDTTNAAHSGVLSGAGSLIKIGTNTQTITGNNNYTGKTAINGGVLSIGNGDSALGALPGSAVADQLSLSSGTLQFTGNTTLAGNRGVTLNSGGGTFDSQAFTPTINGFITGEGSLTKIGAGTLTLTGSNSFTGGLNINAGTVNFSNNALGNSTTGIGTITLGDAANTGAAANLVFTTGAFNTNMKNPINVVGTGTRSLGVTSYSPNYSGAVTLNDTDLTLWSNNTGGSTMTISGGITGTGNITLQNNSSNAKVNLTTTMINNVGSITVNGTGVGVNNNSDTTISAIIGSNVTGVIGNAPGYNLILSGSNSSFAGGVTIQSGTVWLKSSIYAAGTAAITLGNTTGSANSTLIVDTGSGVTNPINVVEGNTGTATIRINSNNTVLNSPIVLQNHDVTLSKIVTGQGQMAGGITGTGNVTINNLDSTHQLQLVTGQINNVGTITNSSVASAGSASAGGSTITAVIGNNVTGLIQDSDGFLALNAANTFKGDTTITSGTVLINHSNGLQNSVANLNNVSGKLTFGGLTGSAKVGGLAGNGDLDLTNVSGTAVNLTIGHSNTSNGSATNANTLNPVYAGIISGDGSLTKTGSNTQTLNGINTYTGPTNVNEGTLIVGGGIAGSVTVNNSAIIGGNGTIGALTATAGATVAPGAAAASSGSAAILNVNGNVDLGSTGLAHLTINIGGTTAGEYHDQVNILGGSTLNLTNVDLQGSLLNGYTPTYLATLENGNLNLDGEVFYLVIGAGSINGTFANQISKAESAQFGFTNYASIMLGGQLFAISYDATAGASFSNGGNDIALMAIPEPGTWALLLGGMGMLTFVQRLRRRSNS